MAVYGYARVSTTMQSEDGESLGVQERQIRGWCMMNAEEDPVIYVEGGVSGSVPFDERPEGAKLVRIVKKGDTIITARLDRLFRSALDALNTVEKLRQRGVKVVVIDGLGDITGNGMGRAFMIIAATFAEMEREAIKDRIRIVKKDQRARNRYLGGKVPFGYRVEDGGLVPIDDEQAMVILIRQTRAGGASLRQIQATVEAEFDRKLSLATLHRLLTENVLSDEAA